MSQSVTYDNLEEKVVGGIKGPATIKLLIVFFLSIWCAGFLFPIIAPQFTTRPFIEQWLKYSFSLVCHQNESASLSLSENHLLVCARCSGIYFGALLTSLIMMFKIFRGSLNLKPLFIFTSPLIFDAIAVRIQLYIYSKALAFTTGLLFGAIVILYIFEALQSQSKNSIDYI